MLPARDGSSLDYLSGNSRLVIFTALLTNSNNSSNVAIFSIFYVHKPVVSNTGVTISPNPLQIPILTAETLSLAT